MSGFVSRAAPVISGAAKALAWVTIVASSAGASIQDPLNENPIPTFTATHTHGEIDCIFDTTLNKGLARYRTSLASGNLLKRLFVSPTVHTLVATYEFARRTDRLPAGTIQLTLISDESRFASDAELLPSHVMPLLVVFLGKSELRYPLGISQSTEAWSNTPRQPYNTLSYNDRVPQIMMNALPVQVHVHRSATASLGVCEFVALANARDLRGTVAGLDFHFGEEILAGLRQFVAEMRPPATMC